LRLAALIKDLIMQNTVHDTFICKTFMRWLALIIFRISGWKVSGERPRIPKYVIIAEPHTSNWDFLYTVCLAFIFGIKPRIMMKSTLFWGPVGTFLRWLGAIPIDRSGSHNVVAQSIRTFNQQKRMVLLVPPSGTRRKVMYWKSGFYHIARGADVPVVLGYLDYKRKTGGIGPTVDITGHMEMDMENIQDFYAHIEGKYPTTRVFDAPLNAAISMLQKPEGS
jgi:1-acyl-sn-glycerol-3-phosphate acyltransferase